MKYPIAIVWPIKPVTYHLRMSCLEASIFVASSARIFSISTRTFSTSARTFSTSPLVASSRA